MKAVRREVDQEQGSNRPNRLVLKLTGEQRNQDQDQRLLLSSVACFFSALEFNRMAYALVCRVLRGRLWREAHKRVRDRCLQVTKN